MKQNIKTQLRFLFVAVALFIALFIGGCGGSSGPVGGGFGYGGPFQPTSITNAASTTPGSGTTKTKQAVPNPQTSSDTNSDK